MKETGTGRLPLIEGIELEPRSLFQIVDGAFRLYRRHFLFLVLIAAIPNMLLAPLFIIPGRMMEGWADELGAGSESLMPRMILTAAVSILITTLQVVLTLMLVAAAMRSLAEGEGPNLRPALRRAFHRWPGLLVATIGHFGVSVVLFVPACVFCFIPFFNAVYGVFACLFAHAMFFENLDPFRATVRSFRLVGGHFLHAAGILFLTFIIFGNVVEGILTLPVQVVVMLREGLMGTPAGALLGLLSAAQGVSHAVAWPLMAAAVTLLYYDILARREGFDLRARCIEHGIPLQPGLERTPAGEATASSPA
jgi:hypothetical protein